MTITQMKYFITAAKCLNFTKAASQLYITQSALSRQIVAMEEELNLQLFVRNNRRVKLTPAAVVLLEEFEKIYDSYNLAIAKAENSFAGISGTVNIGVLEGAYVGDLFPGVLQHFAEFYPQVKINLRNYSFNRLVEKLFSNELDLILTLKFEVDGRTNLAYEVIEKTRDYVVVHKDHRLANASYVKLSDFKDDYIMMVSPEDSEQSPKLILDACKRAGFSPKVKFATSLQEEMLWVQAGVGVCILDSRNYLFHNDAVRFLPVDVISDPSLSIAWSLDNYNPMKKVFKDCFLQGQGRLEEPIEKRNGTIGRTHGKIREEEGI